MKTSRWAVCRRLLGVGVLAAVAATMCATPGAAESATSAARTCRDVSVPVGLTAHGPENEQISGRLCSSGAASTQPLQILVHGFTLTRDYWELPGVDPQLSYAAAADRRGYTTFAIDRIGVGASSTPPALSVTLDSNVESLHDVVTAARTGLLTGARPASVTLVGHSLGTAVAVTEAGRYHDVDAVVATSFLHVPGPGAASLIASSYPAQLDPAFSGAGLPAGYVTTLPGARRQFYSASADPAVIAADERTKGTGTVGEVATFADYSLPGGDGSRTTAPVFLVIGQQDPYFCTLGVPCPSDAAVVDREAPFFPRTKIAAHVVPGTAHNLALEKSSPVTSEAILDWVHSNVG